MRRHSQNKRVQLKLIRYISQWEGYNNDSSHTPNIFSQTRLYLDLTLYVEYF